MVDYGKVLSDNPLVSIIIDTYYRPEMLKRAVNCILGQTYKNTELIIVNNGATPETIEYILALETKEEKVSLVHFKENQFSWDDPHLIVRVCYNAGLAATKGDIVFYQSDDDWVANDFIERMVKLFLGNPKCTTAIGRVVNSLYDGTVINMYEVRERDTYINGYDLAIDLMDGAAKLVQPNPGHSFVIKRDILIKCGGFQDIFEYHQMLGIVPFGETGFDPEALMYWGRGPEQLNVIVNKDNKFFWGTYFINNIKSANYSLIEKWRSNFGDSGADKVKKHLDYLIKQSYYRMIITDIFKFQFKNKKKFSTTDLNYINSIPFDSFIFFDSLKESCRKLKGYKYFSLTAHVFKMFIRSPIVTIKRIATKITKH